VRSAYALLVAFHNGVRSIVPPFIWRVGARQSPLHYGASMIISPPFFFSPFHLKTCVGLAKLKIGPQYFNYIEFDLFVF